MKSIFTFLAGAALLAERAVAVPTWPSPQVDEIEDVMFLRFGYNSRQFSNGVTPCSSSPDGTSRSAAAEWIRTAFHDMATAQHYTAPFVGGIDASLLFETTRDENIGAAFPTTLNTYSPFFNTRASMADLIAVGVYAATRSCGGPAVPMRAGRKDATQADVTGVPEPQNPTLTLLAQFARAGFSQPEAIQLTACGHTVGGVHAANFPLIVPPGSAPNDYGFCDSTAFVFDNKVVQEYLGGNSTDPMTVGISVSNKRNSDGRMFGSDNNVTVQAMADPASFQSTCSTVFQKMVETVDPVTTLSDVIVPYDVKPNALQLTLLSGGTSLTFSGEIRVRTTVRAANLIKTVQLIYKNRSGGAGGTITAAVAGTATGFDDTFTFYKFSATLDSTTSISSFTVLITLTTGGTETYNNNGAGFPVQDSIFYMNPQSCIAPAPDANNNRPLTIVAAVRNSLAAPTVTMDVILRVKRTDIPTTINVPALQDVSSAMTFAYSLGPYNIYTVTYPLAYAYSFNAEFGVTVVSGATKASDSFKNTINLLSFCGPSLAGTGSSSTTSTTSTTSSAATSSTGASGWTVMGCYTDDVNARSLPYVAGVTGGAAAMTNELCQATCKAAGYVYAGTEYAGECYCGNALQNAGAPATDGNALCNMACNGNAAEICGGPNRLSLFRYGAAASTTTITQTPTTTTTKTSTTTVAGSSPTASGWTALGCYNDTVSARGLSAALGVTGGPGAMTIELCLAACYSSGYVLAGLEYAQECYCDNAFKNGAAPAVDGTTQCNMACSGNSAENCGGPNRLNVFKYGAASPTTTMKTSTSTPAPTSTAASMPTNWASVGCYSDNVASRSLTVRTFVTGDMTVEKCLAACAAGGYALAGVEYAVECYCDSTVNNGGALATDGNAGCNMPCAGNTAEMCGGSNRLNVYKSTAVAVAVKPMVGMYGFYGCYSDVVTARALSALAESTTAMTLEMCAAFCKGYTYFGTEYAQECYCGNALAGSVKESISDCSMLCSSEPTEFCGAGNRLSVYKLSG